MATKMVLYIIHINEMVLMKLKNSLIRDKAGQLWFLWGEDRKKKLYC